jgi:hypothetical protein
MCLLCMTGGLSNIIHMKMHAPKDGCSIRRFLLCKARHVHRLVEMQSDPDFLTPTFSPHTIMLLLRRLFSTRQLLLV